VSTSRSRRGVTEAKILPPAGRRLVVSRPRLDPLLADLRSSRLSLVVAGAGFGKTTLLAEWAARERAAWYTVTAEDRELTTLVQGVLEAVRFRLPALARAQTLAMEGARGPDAHTDELGRARAYAGLVSAAVQDHARSDLVLILDDVDEVYGAEGAVGFLEALCRQAPEPLHLALACRHPVPFSIERLRGRGQVLEIGGSALVFDEAEVAAVLREQLGSGGGEIASLLRDATRGWPAAVRLAGEALRTIPARDRAAAVRRLPRPGGPVYTYLAEEVFSSEPPEVLALVRAVAPLEAFTPELAEALGVPEAGRHVAELERRGLFLDVWTDDGWFALRPLIRQFVIEHLPHSQEELRSLRLAAAEWFERHERYPPALRELLLAQDREGVARVLTGSGRALLASGASELVIRAAAWLPDEDQDAAIHRVVGEAHQVRGEWDRALERYGRLVTDGDVDPAVAWRMGLIHHLRGELERAIDVYERGRIGAAERRDDALLLAWTAAAQWLRGEVDRCRELSNRAFDIAEECGDDEALAAAHTALALLAALDSDRRANDAHYLHALDHAERAGDVLQVIRIRANRGSRLTEEAYFEEAIEELDIAIRLAELAGFSFFQSLAQSNRGEALLRLGRLDEAVTELEAARDLLQRLGSRVISYPLCFLGDVSRERGDLALARSAYEEAVEVSSEVGDLQGLIPALAGLAQVLAEEEPEEARRVASRALSHDSVLGRQRALLAAGWVDLARGDPRSAAAQATEAMAISRNRRDRAAVAEALELAARASDDRSAARGRLEEARAIWLEIGGAIGEARVDLALARLAGPDEALELTSRAEARFRELGARRLAAEAAELAAGLARDRARPVVIHSLGGFRVVRDGEPVALTEWQSRKARTLLKILAARRGQPVHREELIELLWPEEDPAKTSSRLSVALSTLRAVLDPSKRFDAEHVVSADRQTVRLEIDHVEVDVERFLREVRDGLADLEAGREDRGLRSLASAEAAYAGDFLPEDPFEDWAVALREEGRNAYVAAARSLAVHAGGAGDHDSAARYLLRILERDAFDERAHLSLVSAFQAAGRHGEARRAYRLYASRMNELGIEALPFTEATRG
jgi:ATP/maltotriose-dependent transcriptional regulator MalT/DNA-binding SARP family transcriptional activator